MTKYITALMLLMVGGSAMAATMTAPQNPATGIWIQQVGDIVPHASSKATLYYTKYEDDKIGDRVKGISYQYNGAGYLLMKPSDKKTVCLSSDGVSGADGIVEHPDGDLLIAGQGTTIYKVSKTAGSGTGKCMVKKAKPAQSTNGFWHLMMDPTQKILWAAGIPGPLFRFSTDMTAALDQHFSDKGYKVNLRPNASNRRKDTELSTIIWDGEGTAFFTYSGYLGGGCESNGGKSACSASRRLQGSEGAYFGYFTDTAKVKVTSSNIGTYGGNIGDSVIASFGTKILIDSLEGAHGGTYDPYSKTIFVFGGARIVQIRPKYEEVTVNRVTKRVLKSASVVAYIDLREYFFEESDANLSGPRTPGVGWRLDQGTVDGNGHLFVASNTGHMIFVDYAANPNQLINDNVLIHVQWIDNYLDDVAPLKGVIVDRNNAASGSDGDLSSSSFSSSSLVEYNESSSSVSSSSSTGKSSSSGAIGSSGSNPGSSSSVGSSGSTGGKSSSSNGGSSPSSSAGGGDPSSSNGGGNPGSSGSNGGNPGSSGSTGGSSNSGDNPGSSAGGNSGSNSSSSRGNGSGEDSGFDSSSSRGTGAGEDSGDESSSSRVYYGAEDWEEDDGSGFDSYPSAEDFDQGDSIVAGAVILSPATPDPSNPNILEINGNSYLMTSNPKGENLDLHHESKMDSAKVGQIVAITLDSNKVKQYFGSVDSLKVVSNSEIKLVDPQDGSKEQTVMVNVDGSVTIFVTADEAVRGGSIKVIGNKEMVIIDNINFYDPIPDTYIGYIKDRDGDKELDYVEILLKDSISQNYSLDYVWLLVGSETIKCSKFELNGSRDRVLVDLSDLVTGSAESTLLSVGKFPKDAKAVVGYTDGIGSNYSRESSIVEVGSFVIKEAYAIRDNQGMDSLFIHFNIDLIPADLGTPEQLVLLKQKIDNCKIEVDADGRCGFTGDQIKKVFMPSKDVVILVGKNFGLNGDMNDSISLHSAANFFNLPYITSDEYDREVPVKVIDRFASAKKIEYWDVDGDGVLDQIVTVFDRKLTQSDIDSTLYMSFNWYSYRGMVLQLQAQPADLILDPNDSTSTRVVWEISDMTKKKLATGITSINDSLPPANVFTYYSMFCDSISCKTFINEESVSRDNFVDRMPPVVSNATLSYGNKSDTLLIVFSEAIMTKGLKGTDFFSYIHGNDTLELNPTRIDWSADGFSAKLIIDGGETTIMPGDYLIVHKGKNGAIKDNFGNIAGENPQPIIIGGMLNHLVESLNMGSFNVNDDRIVDEDEKRTYTLQTVSSVNLRYVPGSTTKEDLQKEGALGQLVQLGERFVPQLLDRAQVAADGSYDPSVLEALDSSNVYISFIVNYFDHLGQYVNDTIITVPCDSPKFGPARNCLDSSANKVFVNWNFKDHKGRFVGTGVYNVQFKMIVRYEDKKIEEEIKDKWGVRRRKKK